MVRCHKLWGFTANNRSHSVSCFTYHTAHPVGKIQRRRSKHKRRDVDERTGKHNDNDKIQPVARHQTRVNFAIALVAAMYEGYLHVSNRYNDCTHMPALVLGSEPCRDFRLRITISSRIHALTLGSARSSSSSFGDLLEWAMFTTWLVSPFAVCSCSTVGSVTSLKKSMVNEEVTVFCDWSPESIAAVTGLTGCTMTISNI